eukprot:CAMPEP_0116992588 /NCGR_PEP_ID=MMETSP0467-20121206/66895_1 /TAXON_ID=283647 /ORGANISM="Mesodinium pulex, Strain SPMC105" /LENGTH=154 /DNA_ID=CAMNT_0004690035 /DNA_START=751 /DNA_END=1215 /DNA_ORIENTATION=-
MASVPAKPVEWPVIQALGHFVEFHDHFCFRSTLHNEQVEQRPVDEHRVAIGQEGNAVVGGGGHQGQPGQQRVERREEDNAHHEIAHDLHASKRKVFLQRHRSYRQTQHSQDHAHVYGNLEGVIPGRAENVFSIISIWLLDIEAVGVEVEEFANP